MTMNKSNKYTYIVIISIFILTATTLFLISFSLQPAYAIERTDIQETKNQIKSLENSIRIIDTKINSQKIIIDSNERTLENAKTAEKEKRKETGTSWSAFKELDNLKQNIINAEEQLRLSKETLELLITEKNNMVNEIKILEEKLESQEDELYIQNKPDLTGLTKIIGVYLSGSCITMIQNNYSTHCPTYNTLYQLDTSDKYMSGDFITDENGYFHRQEPQLKESWRAYDFDDTFRIIVDPPSGMIERIKTIEIRPNFDTYTLSQEMIQKPEYQMIEKQINFTGMWFNETKTVSKAINVMNKTKDFGRVIFHDRYIDKCKHAIINAANWTQLVADTIHHLRSNCAESTTSYITKEVLYPNYTEIDYASTNDYKYKKWLSQIKQFCIFKYHQCKE